jgi:putative endonuclease
VGGLAPARHLTSATARPDLARAGFVHQEHQITNPLPGRDAAITIAARYLESAGFRIVDRAWTAPDGQLDIAAVDRQVFVVCQVTMRSRARRGTPLEAAGQARIRRLRGLAVAWLNAHGMRFEQVRIDAVGLVSEGTGGYTIEHLRGVG